MLFLFAFLIGSAGLALLVLGELRFRGKEVPARTVKQIGGVLAGLFPAFLVVRFLMELIDRESRDYAPIVFCFLCVIDLGIAAYLFFKAVGPLRATRPTRVVSREVVNPFAETPEPTPAPAPGSPPPVSPEPVPAPAPAPKARKRKGAWVERDPFDFS